MIPYIYVLIFIAFLMFVIAIVIQSWVLGSVSGVLLMMLGIYIIVNGVAGMVDVLTYTIAVVSIGIGAIAFINGGLEKILESGI